MTTKSISFKGINRAVPQSESGDGYCQEIINMRFRKGCWRPIPEKVVIGSSLFTYLGESIEFDAIYLHDIEGGINTGDPNWIGVKDNGLYLINPLTRICLLLEGNLNTDITINVTFLKRFLLVATGSGLFMYLFADGAYAKVESLPTPEVCLHKNNVFIVDSPTIESATSAAGILANYYAALNSQSSTEGRLYGSIMYMAAYKLFDGSYILPSIPQYFELSNDGVFTDLNRAGSGNRTRSMKFTVSGIKASMDMSLATYSGTKDLIESICVFATRATNNWEIDEITLTDITADLHASDKSRVEQYFSELFPLNAEFGKLPESEGWYKIHEFRFDEIVSSTSRVFQDVDTKGFYQNYATNETLTTDEYSHHSMAAKTLYTYNDRLHAAGIKTLYGDMYVSWINFSNTYSKTGSTTGKAIAYLKTGLGEVITITDINVPTYRKSTITTENKATEILATERLAYINANPSSVTNFVVGSGFVKRKFMPTGFNGVPIADNTYIQTTLPNVESWDVCYSVLTSNTTEYYVIPAAIGYNDSRAYRMMLTVNIAGVEKRLTDVQLEKNTGMNFAYYVKSDYKGSSVLPSSLTFVAELPDQTQTPYDNNRIQASEIQNPLVFPTANSYQVGTGDIYAIMAGSEPMSTGQFGQFPLQVFTSKGVYSMETGTGDVLYTNILPVAGEVADNAKNIISVSGGVLYSTEKGLFVLVGRQPTQLSEIVEGTPELSMSVNKTEINTLLSDTKFTPGLAGSLSDIDFLEYIDDSIVGFDQINKELIVSNKAKGYSYIYSFESKLWFKVSRSYTLLINNWPRLTGISGTTIYDLSSEETSGMVEAMIITCAQSFELPEVSKKIERVILRSKISTTEGSKYAGMYIFASDDVETYQIITGRQRTGERLKDMLNQRSPGSAKFYVFVVNGSMSVDSEIKNIDVDFVAKWNGKLR